MDVEVDVKFTIKLDVEFAVEFDVELDVEFVFKFTARIDVELDVDFFCRAILGNAVKFSTTTSYTCESINGSID